MERFPGIDLRQHIIRHTIEMVRRYPKLVNIFWYILVDSKSSSYYFLYRMQDRSRTISDSKAHDIASFSHFIRLLQGFKHIKNRGRVAPYLCRFERRIHPKGRLYKLGFLSRNVQQYGSVMPRCRWCLFRTDAIAAPPPQERETKSQCAGQPGLDATTSDSLQAETEPVQPLASETDIWPTAHLG